MPDAQTPDDHDTMAKKALLTKSDHWTYEAEWRLLRLDHGPGAVQFRPSNLTGIVIGAMASHDTISVTRQWRDRRPTPLALYQARISPREFSLSIARMD